MSEYVKQKNKFNYGWLFYCAILRYAEFAFEWERKTRVFGRESKCDEADAKDGNLLFGCYICNSGSYCFGLCT